MYGLREEEEGEDVWAHLLASLCRKVRMCALYIECILSRYHEVGGMGAPFRFRDPLLIVLVRNDSIADLEIFLCPGCPHSSLCLP